MFGRASISVQFDLDHASVSSFRYDKRIGEECIEESDFATPREGSEVGQSEKLSRSRSNIFFRGIHGRVAEPIPNVEAVALVKIKQEDADPLSRF